MELHPDIITITDPDDAIHHGVADAAIPPLLAAVAHLTGDLSILVDDLRPDLGQALAPNGGYDAERSARARRLAASALIAHRDNGNPPPATLDPEAMQRIVAFVCGGEPDPAQLPLLEEELALDVTDRRAPTWRADELAPGRRFVVGIIGAGMSGIVAAHRLRQAGVEVVVFEKNHDVGGTWLENDYPGCRVDVQSHLYSYSFAQTPRWPHYHSTQPVLLDYFRTCVDELGLRDLIQFGTEVTDATWDDDAQHWQVDTTSATGAASHTVHALVSAVGQLNRPLMPDIPGLGSFEGPAFHSARWDHFVDLTGKRVAVIGTGASALQFIPVVADVAEHLTIFQRTPPWLLPVPNYLDDISVSMRWLLDHVPAYAHWDRLALFARTQEGLLPLATVDPAWEPKDRSVSELNELLRAVLEQYYVASFPDPELRAAVLPQYPPTAKRVVLDNGIYPRTLQRDDVTLTTSSIERITPRGVRTVDGVEHEFDVLLYGTGFQASKFLTPMRVRGAAGADLHERWGGDARAYLGIVVPEFPNLFLMYGPNTNIVINGSIIYFSECEATYIVDAIRFLLESGTSSLDCRPDVHEEYGKRIDDGNRLRAWGVADVNSWYRNEFGRVAQNWPFNLFEYWRLTRRADPADFAVG